MKRFFFVIFFILFSISVFSQEFLCNVSVNSSQIEGTDKRVYENLQSSLTEFINNRVWTNYSFKPEERIECSILITIDERSGDVFSGKLNLALRRPVFNTSYNTVLFNFIDESFQFEFVEFQTLEFVENTYTSNLTSVVAYYLYLFLGLDFDSFSMYGGTPFFEKAQAIVNTAQASRFIGWKAYESTKNRYWIIENILNPSYRDIRKFLYEYHRLGFDVMSDNMVEGRDKISKSLRLLRVVHNERPNLFFLQLLLATKRDEFIKLFSDASKLEKTETIEILSEIDPANTAKYQAIQKQN